MIKLINNLARNGLSGAQRVCCPRSLRAFFMVGLTVTVKVGKGKGRKISFSGKKKSFALLKKNLVGF